jgi:hypothetical protein
VLLAIPPGALGICAPDENDQIRKAEDLQDPESLRVKASCEIGG